VFRTEPPVAEGVTSSGSAREFSTPMPAIALLVPTGDEAAQRMAAALTELLVRVGWKMRGVTEDAVATSGCSGLILAASPSLPLQRVTSTLNALREAGFAVSLQLDPDRHTTDAALIVGGHRGPVNGAGLKSEALLVEKSS